MARKKVNPEPILRSWIEVDAALKEMISLTATMERAESDTKEKLAALKAEAAKKISRTEARFNRLAKDIEEYTAAHKEELPWRSKKLLHGTAGFRRSKSVGFLRGFKKDQVIEILRSLGRTRKFLRVKYDLNKDAIRDANLPKETLAEWGLKITESDKFGYTLDEVKLREALEA